MVPYAQKHRCREPELKSFPQVSGEQLKAIVTLGSRQDITSERSLSNAFLHLGEALGAPIAEWVVLKRHPSQVGRLILLNEVARAIAKDKPSSPTRSSGIALVGCSGGAPVGNCNGTMHMASAKALLATQRCVFLPLRMPHVLLISQ